MKNLALFITAFLSILCLDIIFNNVEQLYWLRFFTKPGITISLALFLYVNRKPLSIAELVFTFEALCCLLLGDVFLLERSNIYFFAIGLVTYMVANFLYILVFYNDAKFHWSRLTIYLLVMVGYVSYLFTYLHHNLGPFYTPVVIFIIIAIAMTTLAFLRNGKVNNTSFYLVWLGTISAIVSLSIVALNRFYKPVPFKDTTIMFFYGLGHLGIVIGILYKYQDMKKVNDLD